MESFFESLNIQWLDTEYGRYAALMQPAGSLLPEAATLLCKAVRQTGADCLYADAAVEMNNGMRPIYKPAFSPDTLLSYNYVGSPLFLSEKLWQRICRTEGLRLQPADRQYLLTVRALLLAKHTEHIPHILFRGAEPPVPMERDAVCWGLSALGRQAAVGRGLLSGSFAVRYSREPRGRLSVIVRTSGDADALRRTLEAFELRCTCLDYEFLIAAGGLLSEREQRYCAMLQKYRAAKICYFKGETNDARIKNLAAAQAGGEYLLFLSAGVEPDSADAVDRMISHAGQRRTAAVGGVLLSEDGSRLQSELWVDEKDRPVPRNAGKETVHAVGSTEIVSENCIRNVTLLGGDAFLLRSDVFLESGGFDETFDSCYCEAALSISMAQRQMYNVCTPYARFLRRGVRRAALSRRNAERCGDVFRTLRVHGDPLCSQNAAYLKAKAEIGMKSDSQST